MKKSEILEAMEINTEIITKTKNDIKKLEKARAILNEVGVNDSVVVAAITDLQDDLAAAVARQTKRKKQLKLLEQFEALENEDSSELPGQTEIGDQN